MSDFKAVHVLTLIGPCVFYEQEAGGECFFVFFPPACSGLALLIPLFGAEGATSVLTVYVPRPPGEPGGVVEAPGNGPENCGCDILGASIGADDGGGGGRRLEPCSGD